MDAKIISDEIYEAWTELLAESLDRHYRIPRFLADKMFEQYQLRQVFDKNPAKYKSVSIDRMATLIYDETDIA